jgi:hypothetical protein
VARQTALERILAIGEDQGRSPGEVDSRDWFRTLARKTRTTPERLHKNSDQAQFTRRPLNGRMYLYGYDAKHKATLPYWDRYPLIFPVKKTRTGWYGINFHYLPYRYRADLMDALYTIASDDDYDDDTKVMISYRILSKASKFRFFRPAFKQYLTDHAKTRFLEIPASQWDIAIMLPLARFEKASPQKVWQDSRKMIAGL